MFKDNYNIYTECSQQQVIIIKSLMDINFNLNSFSKAKSLLDPLGTYHLIYDAEITFPLQIGQSQPQNYPTTISMYAKQDKLFLYIFSETDLYFCYYKQYMKRQLRINQEQVKNMNNCYKCKLGSVFQAAQMMMSSFQDIERNLKQGKLSIRHSNQINLVITHCIGSSIYEVLAFKLEKESENFINKRVAYRYGCLKQTIALKEQRISELKGIIKSRNPYILSHLPKIL